MPRLRLLALTIACAAVLGACAGGSTATAESTATTPSAAPSPVSEGVSTTRVSANTASTDELVAALTAAGVPNPDRWAREIEEYRPYDTNDAMLQKLQDNLAKYNPSADTLAGILSALVP